MNKSQADRFLFFAVFAWVISCTHPALGMLMQFPVIVYLVWRCDVKALPALMILMLGRGNINFFDRMQVALRLGITLSPTSCFAIAVFFFAVINICQGRYDRGATTFSFFWMLAIIPAAVMSFHAKRLGLAGMWSGPIMDSLIPGIYYWSLSLARSYEKGSEYLLSRLTVISLLLNVLSLSGVVFVFTFFQEALPICLFLWSLKLSNRHFWVRLTAFMGFLMGIVQALFGRRLALEAAMADMADADKIGSTFSRLGVLMVALLLAWMIKRVSSRHLLRLTPIFMLLVNVFLVLFVVNTQSGNAAQEVNQQYDTMEERFKYKLFGDRAAVWTMGWEEMKTPPFFFKNLEDSYEIEPNGQRGMRLLPHNQFLTLLGREGWWLGLTLSIFIVWIWARAFGAGLKDLNDAAISLVFLPVGAAVYFVVGIAGQSVVSMDLWGNALVAIVFPGIIYGQSVWKIHQKNGRDSYAYSLV